MDDNHDYKVFHEFIKTFIPSGFDGIDRCHPLILELEEIMEVKDQFFYIADMLKLKVLFTSNRSADMLGINPDELTPYHILKVTHPDDIQRLNLAKCKLVERSHDLYVAEKGDLLVSTNFKVKHPSGEYFNMMTQNLIFYTTIPYKTVFLIKVHTNINWCKRIKRGYHYYIGADLSYFRYPDDEFLSVGNIFSKREFEIIKMIMEGLSSEQIAEKLFLSRYTVNTHRVNILKKSKKAQVSDLIYELKEWGLL